jgi:death on curing protein
VPSQSEFIWIDVSVVLAIHEAQIAEHGGALGLRDLKLLLSGLSRPRNAALYALSIIRNHPFADGNKRVGAVLLETFLNLNGYQLDASDDELYESIFSVAAGNMRDQDFTRWVRAPSQCATRSP